VPLTPAVATPLDPGNGQHGDRTGNPRAPDGGDTDDVSGHPQTVRPIDRATRAQDRGPSRAGGGGRRRPRGKTRSPAIDTHAVRRTVGRVGGSDGGALAPAGPFHKRKRPVSRTGRRRRMRRL